MFSPETVVNQLTQSRAGYGKLSFMCGAKNFGYCPTRKHLHFRLGSGARFEGKTVNFVKITLTPADLYDIEYGYARGSNYTVRHISEGLYFDMMKADFEANTGMYLSL